MKIGAIDLHLHTACSDGSLSVKEMLEQAEKSGMSLISITDHNTVDAYDEIGETRNTFSGKIIPGVELSTLYNGELIEILGYGFDIPSIKEFIQNNYLRFAEKTLKERQLILEQYNKKGIVMSDEFRYNMVHNPTMYYNPDNESCRPPFFEEIKKHPENEKFFGGKKQMSETTINDFFRKHYSRPSSPLYVDVSPLVASFEDVLSAIHNAGGYAFIAHVFLYSENVKNDIEKLIQEYNIDGYECYYSRFTKEQSEYLSNICEKNNKYKSGGSDFHGAIRPNSIVGKSTEGMSIDISLVNDWMKGIKNYV